MPDLEIVGISLFAVFVGLAILSFIISLFPYLIPAKKKQPAAEAAGMPAPVNVRAQEEEELEMAAIIAAVSQAFEDEQTNPLVRNSESL
jgi:Na+-transporting methylmalonyl-CoA/oxaloacetate decarboxylase gamma subunit